MADPKPVAAPVKKERKARKAGSRTLPEFHIRATQIADNKVVDIDVAHGTREAKAVARIIKRWCADRFKDVVAKKFSTMNFD